MAQRSDFHAHDVLEHSLRTCKYADKSIRLAALLHDVGKPAAMRETGKFHGHDVLGEGIAREVLERLKAPKKVTELVCRLTALHMYDLDGKAREGKVRSFIVKNYDVYEPLLLLKQADYSGCKDDLSPCPTLVKWRGIEEKMRAEGVPFTLKQLAVRGDEAVVVDYKYSSLSEQTLREEYAPQMEIYAEAASRWPGVRRVSSYLVNILRGYCVRMR